MPFFIIIGIAIKLESKGPIIYFSSRVGRGNKIFQMPKFRTMYVDAPCLPTHLLVDSSRFITPLGSILRVSSLDELPQLWSIFRGDMSFVGPRPALFSQDDLITLRSQHGVDSLTPGITGLAQVNGRDDLSIKEKVQYDVEYLNNHSFSLDLKILFLTVLMVFRRSGVSH